MQKAVAAGKPDRINAYRLHPLGVATPCSNYVTNSFGCILMSSGNPFVSTKQKSLEFNESNRESLLCPLFFQARNLAIESMLLRIENSLLRMGFPVKCEWSESSNLSPCIYIRFLNVDGKGSWEYGTSTIILNRSRITVYDRDQVSDLFYSVKSVNDNEHWGAKQPKKMIEFRMHIKKLGEDGFFATEVDKVNFPFDRKSYSLF